MHDESQAVQRLSFDFSDEEPTNSVAPERDWPHGSQPIPVEAEEVMHCRHIGEQVWHRVVAGGQSSIGYECACSRIIEYALSETRTQANRGTPCNKCFTDFEQHKFVPELAGTWRHHLDGPHKKEK